MSFGRSPYYIWLGLNDKFSFVCTSKDPDHEAVDTTVPYDAIAQLIATLAARGDDAVNALIERGKQLRPDSFTDDLSVTVTGGFKS